MTYSIGVTQWFFPGLTDSTLVQAKTAGFDAVQLELGSSEDHFPLSLKENQQRYLEASRESSLMLLPLTVNDLCRHPFVNGWKLMTELSPSGRWRPGLRQRPKCIWKGSRCPISEKTAFSNLLIIKIQCWRFATPVNTRNRWD